jgi:hypothetical protein
MDLSEFVPPQLLLTEPIAPSDGKDDTEPAPPLKKKARSFKTNHVFVGGKTSDEKDVVDGYNADTLEDALFKRPSLPASFLGQLLAHSIMIHSKARMDALLTAGACIDAAIERVPELLCYAARTKNGGAFTEEVLKSPKAVSNINKLFLGVSKVVKSPLQATALYTACAHHQPVNVKVLLSHGADPTIPASDDTSVLDVMGIRNYNATILVPILENVQLKLRALGPTSVQAEKWNSRMMVFVTRIMESSNDMGLETVFVCVKYGFNTNIAIKGTPFLTLMCRRCSNEPLRTSLSQWKIAAPERIVRLAIENGAHITLDTLQLLKSCPIPMMTAALYYGCVPRSLFSIIEPETTAYLCDIARHRAMTAILSIRNSPLIKLTIPPYIIDLILFLSFGALAVSPTKCKAICETKSIFITLGKHRWLDSLPHIPETWGEEFIHPPPLPPPVKPPLIPQPPPLLFP